MILYLFFIFLKGGFGLYLHNYCMCEEVVLASFTELSIQLIGLRKFNINVNVASLCLTSELGCSQMLDMLLLCELAQSRACY